MSHAYNSGSHRHLRGDGSHSAPSAGRHSRSDDSSAVDAPDAGLSPTSRSAHSEGRGYSSNSGPAPVFYSANTPLGPAIDLLRRDGENFMRQYWSLLFSRDFSLRELFPPTLNKNYQRFQRALVFIVQTMDTATLEPEKLTTLTTFLGTLGCDLRKYNFTRAQYEEMVEALIDTFKYHMPEQWTDETAEAVTTTFTTTLNVMLSAADKETGPATYDAEVMDVLPITRDLAIIRVQANPPLKYLPGQYVSVQIPQCPHTWRYLSPAIPSNPDGYMEFHVRGVSNGYMSRAIVQQTRPGDKWKLSTPRGKLAISGERNVCMVAHDVGLAPMRCLLLDMLNSGNDHPLVDVYYGTDYPGELFDAATLANLQAADPWIIVHICSVYNTDPWWIRNTPELPSNIVLRYGDPLELAMSDGSTKDREIIVGGSAEIVHRADRELPGLGVPPEHIHHDPL